jgi:hypothetical protein
MVYAGPAGSVLRECLALFVPVETGTSNKRNVLWGRDKKRKAEQIVNLLRQAMNLCTSNENTRI